MRQWSQQQCSYCYSKNIKRNAFDDYDDYSNRNDADEDNIAPSNAFGTDRLSILSKLSDKVGSLSNDEFTQIVGYIER